MSLGLKLGKKAITIDNVRNNVAYNGRARNRRPLENNEESREEEKK